MRTSIRKGLAVLTVTLLITGVTCSLAQAEVNASSGKSKITFTKREMIPVGDVEGHVVGVSEATGINENTGKWDFLAGAATSSRSVVDLAKGNGTQNGYFTMSKGGDSVVSKYTGTVRTVLSPEGKPITTYAGEWKWIKCTGIYEGCTGQGTYQGTSVSENEILVEYRGFLAQ